MTNGLRLVDSLHVCCGVLLLSWTPVALTQERDLARLRCTYGSPAQQPADPAASELAKFWATDAVLGGGLFLAYDKAKNQMSLDRELESVATFTSTGPPRPGAIPRGDSVAFSIDMLWLADLRKSYSVARYDVRVDLYSLETEAILEVAKPGQKSELNKTFWVRRGKCMIRAL